MPFQSENCYPRVHIVSESVEKVVLANELIWTNCYF